jgi:hypothetical protein
LKPSDCSLRTNFRREVSNSQHTIAASATAEKFSASKPRPRQGLEIAIAAVRTAIEKAASSLQTAVNPAMAKWKSN